MPGVDPIGKIRGDLQQGMALAKCRKCGCMKEALENLRGAVASVGVQGLSDLPKELDGWLAQMELLKYSCLGCSYCFPAVATNTFNEAFPQAQFAPSACAFEINPQVWPAVPGEYFASCHGLGCPVAVSTLASVELAEKLARVRLKELCIVGKTETENIGIDKLIKNTVTNPTIRFLVLAGQDPDGHRSGKTLVALGANGVDENMRVIGSPGKRPILRNVTRQEVDTFRNHVQIVDLIGCEEVETIVKKAKELSSEATASCGCEGCTEPPASIHVAIVPTVKAGHPVKKEMDRAGYFVITPQPEKMLITVEHYSYDNRLLRVIDGTDARSIYGTIIENGWVTQLSHAAYLGTELARAELSLKLGFKYVQDGA